MSDPLLRWFETGHLVAPDLRETSLKFQALAVELVKTLPPCAERSAALRKLLESKDAAVRARLEARSSTPPESISTKES